MWHATVLTLFPEMFPGPLGFSLPQKATQNHIWELDTLNIRDFAHNKHATVDHTPYGGGAGMVMRADILAEALDASQALSIETRPYYYLSPRGVPFTQKKAQELVLNPGLILICGRYEGIDQRFLDHYSVGEISLGDFVLFGGEVAAMAVLETCIRLLPGAIGTERSLAEESFAESLLEYPHYTRPRVWQGHEVPPPLLSGNHQEIQRWRQEHSEAITQERRPDLWDRYLRTQGNSCLSMKDKTDKCERHKRKKGVCDDENC